VPQGESVQLTAILFALSASLLFALALVLTQYALRAAPPNVGALISLPASTTLLWIVSPWLVDWHHFTLHAAAIFAAVGLLFPAAVTLLAYEGNRRMGPHISGALGNLAPLYALLLAAVMLGEIPRFTQALGIAAIMAGVLVLSLQRSGTRVIEPWWAVLIPLAAAAVRGFAQPVAKLGLVDWPNPFAATLISYSVSCLVILASGFVGGTWRKLVHLPRSPGLLWFVAVGLCNATAVLLLYAALARGAVTLVSPLVATYPLATLVIGHSLLRDERITFRLVSGVLLTVAGVVILIAA
jgi:drug/metabolite transporter (DMT)-like permease